MNSILFISMGFQYPPPYLTFPLPPFPRLQALFALLKIPHFPLDYPISPPDQIFSPSSPPPFFLPHIPSRLDLRESNTSGNGTDWGDHGVVRRGCHYEFLR